MRHGNALMFGLALGVLVWTAPHSAQAACSLPYTLTNGQTADATQVMANLHALAACITNPGPAGATNAMQYNAGGGNFGGVGPLTNGQLMIGSTGNPPVAQTLTAGTGIAITNGNGNVTIAATGTAGGGLYSQVMSATPTAANTGLSQWLNQGSATVADSAVGISITTPSSSGPNLIGRYKAAPATPYTVTALVSSTRNTSTYAGIGIGWYDGSAKLHTLSYATNNGGTPNLAVNRWNSVTSWNSNDFTSQNNAFSQPLWLQIKDDGTNISFAFSNDGANFLQLYSVARSSGWLGAGGYSNIVFFGNPQGSYSYATLMSWTVN